MNIELLTDEIWLPVVGYEKQYLVSNYSRIYSIAYKRLIKASAINKYQRYRTVVLRNKISKLHTGIHRIATIAFIPNPDPERLTDVNHKDGDRENNHISNFEWTTHHENVTHGEITKKSDKNFTGVGKNRNGDRWRSRIYHNKRHIQIGTYDTEDEAALAYQQYCIENGISLKYVA